MDKTALSIVIPVYNEAGNVTKLFDEIIAALPSERYDIEVIFVDDGSRDDTVLHLQQKAEYTNLLRIIKHKRNYGQSAALLSGIRQAQNNIIVTMDGDGQNDPKDIPRLIACYLASNTVVLGNRAKRRDHWLRKISSRIANAVRRSLLHDQCNDTGCSLKLFSREAFLNLPHFNHFHRYLPALFKRAGFRLVNITVNHRARVHGQSKYGIMNRLFVGLHDLVGVRWLIKRSCTAEVIND